MTNVSRTGTSFGAACARISKGLRGVVSFNRTGAPAVRGLNVAGIALGEATCDATFDTTVLFLAASEGPRDASFSAICCVG
jgi:hypothetical protein